MKKYSLSRLTSFALALSVILGGSTIYYANREMQYERYIQTQHQQSLSQLLNSLDHLETALEKAQYLPEDAMRQTLAADVWKESQLAATALSALPLGDKRLEQVETYISQVGDYAYYLMRNTAYDRADSKEWDTLCSLSDNASGFLDEIDQIKEQVDTGSLAFRSVTSKSKDDDGLSKQLSIVNDEFPEYASLIYDGPYSDHVSQRTAKALEGQTVLSQDAAQEKAAALMKTTPDQVTLEYTSDGQIPCYGFSCGTVSCTISKQGGLALSLTDNRELNTVTLSAQQAVDKALQFLNAAGFTNMLASYHMIYEGICTINFASNENGIVAYPDLIKVGVALDDGNIVRLDTAGYAMNHHKRVPVSPVVNLEQARTAVPDRLSIESERLCYIPTTGYREVLCWEFMCKTSEGAHALLYVNCENGQTENLLLLIEDENGTLTR